ncbi:hypothetical protein GWI33_019142 [Rhynchophorus ferrugineus]|uniref:Peptide-N(4)-(N-acetyl-beta-glucosaminyl)asparagine amidase n=1 Tax=Rhynchophorus ferrugineus TaxID=354439 RepID=A0A834HUJ6_RHYFE|nr:hypothetical protein GWI33_019142 [Rhynchophorus ferrugineus]
MSFVEVLDKLGQNSQDESKETVRVLLKIIENILNDPQNPKIRTLQKTNANISKKIMQINGGCLCLKLMGFNENDQCFTLPLMSDLSPLKDAKETLSIWLESIKISKNNQCSNDGSEIHKVSSDHNVKKIILPPMVSLFKNKFLHGVETCFHKTLYYKDKDLQIRAKKLIPLELLEDKAQKRLRSIQEQVKLGNLSDPNISVQDMLILEILQWFKEEFFTWVNSPPCDSCGGKTNFSHFDKDSKLLEYADRVEMHKCDVCQIFTSFPRYFDLNVLLETRKGRCGEWGNTFTLICIAMGWDARLVVDENDHVWTEVYSYARKRWLHCDPCENICDKPLIYEAGWKKKISYIIAYSPDEVQDVTWRYSSNHKEVLKRRNNCTESELIDALMKLRAARQSTLSQSRKEYLTRRILNELIELMVPRKPQDGENQGRQSGDLVWRLLRGEIQHKSENCVWTIHDNNLLQGTFTLRYNPSNDMYESNDDENKIKQLKGWHLGTFSHSNIIRKEEKDWKQVYLSRESSDSMGSIAWKFDIKVKSKTLDTIKVSFPFTTFENGEVNAKLFSKDAREEIPKDSKLLITQKFSSQTDITVIANLGGGTGDVAWQHAQLFRQKLECDNYPFSISFVFK